MPIFKNNTRFYVKKKNPNFQCLLKESRDLVTFSLTPLWQQGDDLRQRCSAYVAIVTNMPECPLGANVIEEHTCLVPEDF